MILRKLEFKVCEAAVIGGTGIRITNSNQWEFENGSMMLRSLKLHTTGIPPSSPQLSINRMLEDRQPALETLTLAKSKNPPILIFPWRL